MTQQHETDAPDLLVSRIFKGSSCVLDRVLAGEGIAYRHWLVLSMIDREPEIAATAIAERLAHDTGALSRVIDGLFERRLVERSRDRSDKRIVRLTTTPAGSDTATRCKALVCEQWYVWAECLTPAELAGLRPTLAKLADAIDISR
jgi:DNA-binding MarR family transcriptional regulator